MNNFSNLNHKNLRQNYQFVKIVLFQHEKILDKKIIFNDNYPYISSTSNNLVNHFKNILKELNLKTKNSF